MTETNTKAGIKDQLVDRINAAMDYYGDNVNQLAKKMGKDNSLIYNYLNKKKPILPGYPVILEICNVYPKVSAGWIMSGEGEMLVEDRSNSLAQFPKTPGEFQEMCYEIMKLIPVALKDQMNHYVSLLQRGYYHRCEIQDVIEDQLVKAYKKLKDQ